MKRTPMYAGLWVMAIAAMGLMAAPMSHAEEEEPSLQVGDKAPEITISEWLRGEPVRIHPEEEEGVQPASDEEAERPIYAVEFWATWCPPCRASIPHLSEIQDEYGEKGVKVVAITREDVEDVRPFVEEQAEQGEMRYHVAVDHGDQTWEAYMTAAQVPGIPHVFLVDREGVITWRGHPMALDEVLEAMFEDEESITEARAASE